MSGKPRTQRVAALRNLIELRLPLDETTTALTRFPWDSDELVVLTRADALRLIRRHLHGDETAVDCQRWAETLEGRYDVDLETGFEDLLKEFVLAAGSVADVVGDLTGGDAPSDEEPVPLPNIDIWHAMFNEHDSQSTRSMPAVRAPGARQITQGGPPSPSMRAETMLPAALRANPSGGPIWD
ncbi:hypothetical protein [Plantactinospora sp. CA-290183]|uniref:hypothetical protein n=1 Tax=Plantactinospora sp. CA-290183 TaxID=3240006 RepID=UPI003D94894B